MKSVLVVNFGSSSIKFKLYEQKTMENYASGMIEVGRDKGIFEITSKLKNINEIVKKMDHEQASNYIFDVLLKNQILASKEDVVGIGHRVVHGADIFTKPTLIKEKELKQLESIEHMAPLHNPIAIKAIKIISKLMPKAINVASFDTAFHSTIPEVNYTYPVPSSWLINHKVRKYGMHGISYNFIKNRLEEVTKKKVNAIVCHLGSGSSICVIKDSQSFNTSMGLTPLAGIMMGKRSGDIDPSIMSFVIRQAKMTSEQVEFELNNHSGIFGICGVSDMRELAEIVEKGTNKKAILASQMWVNRIASYVASYYNALDGNVDEIVFTAGIGENSAFWVEKILSALKTLQIKLDKEKLKEKYSDYQLLTSKDSKCKVYRIRTNEELLIAENVKKFL